MGWRNPINVANTLIVEGPSGTPTGEFVYIGTAGPNTLFSSDTNASTDPFGNATVPGKALYVFNGSFWEAIALAKNGTLPELAFFIGGATQSTPYVQVAGISGSGAVSGGIAVWGAADLPAVYFTEIPPAGIPPAAAANLVYADLNGALNSVRPSGLSGFVTVTLADTSANPNANAGTQPLTNAWAIPKNDAQAGTTYEISVPFNGVFENQTLGFKPSIDGTPVTTSGGDTIGAAFFGAGTGFQGTVRVKLQVLTTGAGGTANVFVDGGLGQNANRSSANQAYLNSQATGIAFDTTVAHTLAVDSVWGGSTAGQTITGHGSDFTRKGP